MSGSRSFGSAQPKDEAELQRQLYRAELRRRMVLAGAFDPNTLSNQAQRILRWLSEWDDWTADGVAELLAAARESGRLAAQQERNVSTPADKVRARMDALRCSHDDPAVGL